MNTLLNTKTALVTGGGAGMGAATAKLFAASGAQVGVADIDQEAGQRVVREVEKAGGTAHWIHADVSDEQHVHDMVQEVVVTYGALHIAVNNAAVTPDNKPLVDLDFAQWDHDMSINLRGMALCLKYELQQLLRQDQGGSIINISSIRGSRGKRNAAAYVAAKHGVVGLTKVAAIEHGADNIRVNCVAPGATDTPMLRNSTQQQGETSHPSVQNLLDRVGAPEEVAQASLWLASDLASYVTGTTIHADGGQTAV